MDRLTHAFFQNEFEKRFLRARGDTFQSLFSSIMEKRHPGDFKTLRPWGRYGDRKNDGLLVSARQLFQCYAPNEMTATKCIKKIDEDFKGALRHWKRHFDEWIFVHNSPDGLGPVQTEKLLSLAEAHIPVRVTTWGFEELRREVQLLAEPELTALLGHAPSRRDLVDLRIEPLTRVLDHIAETRPSTTPDLRPVPPDKLAQNALSDHVEQLLRAGMSRADLVGRFFRDRPSARDRIAETMHQHYLSLRKAELSPDQVFSELQAFVTGPIEQPSPAIQVAVLTVLAFFFEECDIFERPEPQDAS